MAKVQRVLRLILFSVWAVLMTALTYILGAASLKVLRRRLGRAGYWTWTTLLSMGLYVVRIDTRGPQGFLEFKVLALAFFSLVVLIGVFDEFEEMGFSFSLSALFTLLINSLLSAGAFALWVYGTGPKWSKTMVSAFEGFFKPVVELNPRIQVNYSDLILQLPSIAIILWIGAIYVAVLLEGRLISGEILPAVATPPMRPQLMALRLPDACVWIFTASLLGAFGDFHYHVLEALSVNAMNICLVLFFVQGIAVVAKFFESVRMGTFWQILFMVLIVVQLFLFVSLLGLLDFWLGFRARLSKRAEQLKRETKI